MKTQITFRSEPARNYDTGCVIPGFRKFTLIINGQDFSCRDSYGTPHENAIVLAISARYGIHAPQSSHDALSNIVEGYEAPVWVR